MPRETFTISTSRQREIVDISDEVQERIAASGVQQGIACLSVAHCTCALYVNENESGLVADTMKLLESISHGEWRHDRIDDNAAAHLAATLLGSSVLLPIAGGALELGTWQRLMLVELDGPRRRHLTVQVVVDQ